MEGDLLSSMLWKRLKPLVLGKVLFTPDTAFTRQLMAQVGEAWSDGGNERDRDRDKRCRTGGPGNAGDGTPDSNLQTCMCSSLLGATPSPPPGTELGHCRLQMNQTFHELAMLKDVQEVWQSLGPQIFDFLNDSANVAVLEVRPKKW